MSLGEPRGRLAGLHHFDPLLQLAAGLHGFGLGEPRGQLAGLHGFGLGKPQGQLARLHRFGSGEPRGQLAGLHSFGLQEPRGQLAGLHSFGLASEDLALCLNCLGCLVLTLCNTLAHCL